jgi:ABC-2 type transport system permease protein
VLPRGDGVEYRFDPSRPEALVARDRVDDLVQRAAGRADPVATTDAGIREPGGRYIDFLVPGLIGLNLMSGGLWGVGFHLVDMRLKKLLKRLLATPMRGADFLAAQIAIRLATGVLEALVVLGFAVLVFGVPLRGSLASVLTLVVIGAAVFGGLGLLVASRARKIETVSGLMNVVMMPMFVLSGIFFSYERFPEVVHPLIRALPLTALNDALRAVVLEGASLASQAGPLGVLVLWGGLSFVIGLRLFRWQ